jgi:sugar transferase (PEP-CTERM/EpsH1 system associated)
MANAVAAAVKSRSYDIAFVFGSAMAQYVEPWPDLPAILDLVDVDSDKWAQYSNRSHGPLSWLWRIESRRLEKCESAFVQAFSNTLICTEAEAQLLRSKVPCEKIAVLQNSLDTDYFQPKTVLVPETIRALQPYAIFTGTMDYFPNIDAVQFFCNQVLPLIRAKVPNLSFVVAGRSPSTEVMRLMAQPGVKITGTLPDIRPYLKGAAVAVAPMRIARGVQNKILEALAMDVPVVASSVAASALPREVAMLLAAESEPTLLAARVAEQVLAPPERSGIRREGIKQYIEALDLASQLERLLSDAIERPTVCVKEDPIEVSV